MKFSRPASIRLAPAWVLLMLIAAAPALGQSAVPSSGIDLERIGAGELLAHGPSGLRPLPVLEMKVDLEVSGILLHGSVSQSFRNPDAEVLEALYVFPMPEGASVHHMEIRIGERRIAAVLREKEEARRSFQRAREEGRKAALTEQHRPNLFSTTVTNLNPGEIVEVHLEYFQELEIVDGTIGLTFPLTFVPRFNAGGSPVSHSASPVPPSRPAWTAAPPRARLTARIRPGFPLEGADAFSPTHEVDTRWDGEALVVETREATVAADRDYRLEWSPLPGQEPRTVALLEEREDGRYVLLMLLPPVDETAFALPTETLFILDVSHSMAGTSIERAREALDLALGRLRPDDTFNILTFHSEVHAYHSEFLPAEEAEIREARNWVRSLETAGGTRIDRALEAGMNMVDLPDPTRLRRIVFITDGGVNNEEEILRSIGGNLGATRLHTLGIGAAPNRWLLREMARVGRGFCDFIAEAGTLDNDVDGFLVRLDRPVLTDLQLLGLDGEVYPDPLPDLHAGEPMFASLRLPPGAELGRLRLRGTTWDGVLDQEVELRPVASASPGVAQRWARARVRSLLDGLRRGSDPEEVREAVVRTSLDFGIVTRYTSLVAVESFPTAADPATRVEVPNPLPGGVLPRGGTRDRPWLPLGLWLLVSGAALHLACRPGARRECRG